MTKVAGIGPPVVEAFAHVRRGNLVTAHGVEQAESGVRHVAVVTAASRGIGVVMGVTRQARGHLLVTLQTGLIGIHFRRQLIAPRPCIERDSGRRRRMHLVTGDAGKISAFETGRLLHAVRLSPGHPNHSVSPEAVLKKIRLRLAE